MTCLQSSVPRNGTHHSGIYRNSPSERAAFIGSIRKGRGNCFLFSILKDRRITLSSVKAIGTNLGEKSIKLTCCYIKLILFNANLKSPWKT